MFLTNVCEKALISLAVVVVCDEWKEKFEDQNR